MTTIKELRVANAVVPLVEPVAFSTRRIDERHYTLVVVEDSDGVTGIGFCYAGHAGGRTVSTAVLELVAPSVIGQDPDRVGGIWEDTYASMLLHGRSGSVARAQSAVDIAIWDLLARRDGTPLWKRLGAVRAQSVPAYASGGYYPTDFSPGRVAEEMAGYVSAGFSAVKMKIGGGDLRQDAARVAAVRDAIGSDVQLMLDANNAWRDVSSALRAVRLLEPFDPTWIEEPFSPDDIESHARLSALTPVPIATGEIEAGRWRHQALLERRAAAVLQTDAAVCGGITEYRRIADAAAAYGVPMAPHWFHQLHIHLVAATPNAQWVEYFVDTRVFNFQELLTESVTVLSGGAIELPQRPGLGFDFSEDALGRYSPGGWTKA